MTPPATVAALLEMSSSRILAGEPEALVDSVPAADSAEAISGASLLQSGRGLAVRARRAGVGVGDRVAIRLPNGPRYMQWLAAAALGRFVLMSVNPRFSAAEALSLIERSGARLLVTDAAHSVEEAAVPCILDDARLGMSVGDDDSGDLDSPEPDDPYVIFTTSGTTSRPKLVMHTQQSIATHGHDIAAGFAYSHRDTALVAMPLCGTFGLAGLFGSVAANAAIVIPDRFDAPLIGRIIEEHGVTVANGSDDMFHRLLATEADLSTLRLGGYARFNSSLDGIVGRADRVGAALVGLYGMSEVQALFAVRGPSLPVERRERAGGDLVSPAAAVRVVDGELQFRGPSLFAGYLADGGADVDHAMTSAAFDDGWFRSGDLGEVENDSGRTFHFIDRIGDVLRLGGFLVSPAEIESVLVEVGGVEAAQVVAIDRPEGSRPVAFVVASGDVDERSAIDHCAARLARFKVPIAVVEIDEFPTTDGPNGRKIRRHVLRARAIELVGRR